MAVLVGGGDDLGVGAGRRVRDLVGELDGVLGRLGDELGHEVGVLGPLGRGDGAGRHDVVRVALDGPAGEPVAVDHRVGGGLDVAVLVGGGLDLVGGAVGGARHLVGEDSCLLVIRGHGAGLEEDVVSEHIGPELMSTTIGVSPRKAFDFIEVRKLSLNRFCINVPAWIRGYGEPGTISYECDINLPRPSHRCLGSVGQRRGNRPGDRAQHQYGR